MAKSKKIILHITDQRMLDLIEVLKDDGFIRYRQEFCDAIEMPKQNIRNIRLNINGQRFTPTHIRLACKVFNINANWIMDLENNVYRGKGIIKQLKPAAVKAARHKQSG